MRNVRRSTLIVLLAALILCISAGSVLAEWQMRQPFVRLQGVVESRPEEAIGAWVISGQTVHVVETTTISEEAGPAAVGASVVVVALRRNDDTLEARTITVRAPASRIVRLRGIVEELGVDYLVVNGITVRFDRGAAMIGGTLVEGASVRIDAEVIDDQYRAVRIEVSPTINIVPRIIGFVGPIKSMEMPPGRLATARSRSTATSFVEPGSGHDGQGARAAAL